MLEIDETTREVRSFVCVNTLVTDEEGRRLIKEMKRKFSAIISEAELNAMEKNVIMDVENPQLLEHAILNLITNLNNNHYDEEDDAASIISDVSSKCDAKSSKAPLAIIAPNTDSVKPTVSGSINVIKHVRGKRDKVQIKDEPLSPDTCTSSTSSIASTAAIEVSSNGENNSASQNVKVEPNCNILSPTSSYSVSSRDSCDISSPQSVHNNNNSSNSYSRKARTNEFYSSHENLPHHQQTQQQQQQSHNFDIETQASHRNSSCDSFSSNHSTAIDSSANNNHHRSPVLKRTHDINADDDVDEYNEMLKRRMLSSDLSPISQNPPLDLLASITARSGWLKREKINNLV